jgi:HAE1 family hydrophobic/amphiphilic exporter-1
VFNTASVIGLASQLHSDELTHFFRHLKPWSDRDRSQNSSHQAAPDQQLSKLPQVRPSAFPASYSRRRHFGGFTFVLEDRGGDIPYLAANVDKFLAAARKRRKLPGSYIFLPSVPQQFVEVDRDKALKQGVASRTSTPAPRLLWVGSSSTGSVAASGRLWQADGNIEA